MKELNLIVNQLSSKSKNLISKSRPSSLSGRLIMKELIINSASMDSVSVTLLNDQSFRPENILMNNKDQRLIGKVSVDNIVADKITVNSLKTMKLDGMSNNFMLCSC